MLRTQSFVLLFLPPGTAACAGPVTGRLVDLVAHYNYSLRFRSSWALPRDSWPCPKNPQGSALDPLGGFDPKTPEHGVTLSLHPPLGGFDPETPEHGVTLSLHPPLRAFTPETPEHGVTLSLHPPLRTSALRTRTYLLTFFNSKKQYGYKSI